MSQAADTLRDALRSLPPGAYAINPASLEPLHRLVCNVVDELKADGMSPEHVMLAVKGVAYEAKLGLGSAPLIERLVKWCLDQYFKSS